MTVSPRLALGYLLLAAGCHRAQITLDLAQLEHGGEAGGEMGGAAGEAGNEAPGQGGAPPQHPGDSVDPRLCEDELDPIQAFCKTAGPMDCREQYVASWRGCASECGVCAQELEGYPYYFDWHPCCRVARCDQGPTTFCHERCPPPATRDTIAPCSRDE